MPEQIGVARAGFARPSYRPQRAGGIDPDLLRMALVAVAICGALGLAVGAVSLLPRVHHGVPVIAPMAGPVRIKPADPGGMKVIGAEDVAPGTKEKLAPPPERPQIAALRAKVRAAHAAAAIVASPPPQKAFATVPAAGVSGPMVQLAAFDTAELAEEDWGHLAVRMPELFGTRKPEVVRADVHGRAYWRLRTGGFANEAEAAAFCKKVQTHGGDCSVAAF